MHTCREDLFDPHWVVKEVKGLRGDGLRWKDISDLELSEDMT